ncbi:uncharacterized protein EAE97_003509 [Botrytis byssoidea]|uniref:Fungal N-terminal domain-containing protein n=1 Tax=Botrytis byssoidea TaxID=139641 RepID=A0A9P5IVN6_9HELO|nr:uncharacterized protein EAE97_003509 [Botrytis byssoidea]KAF7948098.1 hypothetical protein EAE97_003509 [Botrytis byssoidea]
MAEVLGTVASGIGVAQLAGNLASSIIKLKGYWDEIQDAPNDISFLAREIDSHHLILRSILESQANITSSGRASDMFLEHSLKLCEDSSNELNELVKALGKEMNSSNKWRSKLGATKVVLKNDQLKRLKKRMKNASKVMNTAITWQTNATLQQQLPVFELKIQASLDQFLINHQKLIPVPPLPSPITQISSMNALEPPRGITTISQPQSSECHSNSTPRFVPKDCTSAQISSYVYSSRWSVYLMGSVEIRKTRQQRNRNRFEETEAKYKPPAWLSNRAWQCMYTKDLSALRWNFNIQTYRTLDTGSDFYKALIAGDVLGVHRMLANRTAFLNDRFLEPFGTTFWETTTPLHIAALNAHLDLCKFLLVEGADVSSEGGMYGLTPLEEVVILTQLKSKPSHPLLLDIARGLVEAGAYSELIDRINLLVISASGSMELFQYLQQHTLMISGEISFINKVYIARSFLYSDSVQSPKWMLSYLGGPDFQAKIALHRDDSTVEDFFVGICGEYSQDQFKDDRVDLIKKMISAGVSLHVLDEDYETMLQKEFWSFQGRLYVQEREIWGLEMWLEFLVKLNVDLNTYGEVESSIYKKKRMAQDLDASDNFVVECVLGFKYGPRIEDWDVWFTERTDKYAGDFWKLIQNPLQATLANISIPGEWVD